MYQALWYLPLGILSGLQQDPSTASAEVAIVFEDPGSAEEQKMVHELIAALDESERVGTIHRMAFKLHPTSVGSGENKRMVPRPQQLIADASRSDCIISVGNAALAPFLHGDAVKPPVYSLGARGLAYLPRENHLLPNLHRLAAAVPLDITLAQAVRHAQEVLQQPAPMGVIVSDRVPAELIEDATRAASAGQLVLHIERISTSRELLPAAERLLARGIRNMLFPPDPNGMASPASLLSRDTLRLMLLAKGVAVMGLEPGDQGSHYAFEPDYRKAARKMVDMVLADLDSPRPPDRVIQVLDTFHPWLNSELASRHSIALRPSPGPGR